MLKVLDTTLREGEQMPGICFAPHIRMTIAQLLDEGALEPYRGSRQVLIDYRKASAPPHQYPTIYDLSRTRLFFVIRRKTALPAARLPSAMFFLLPPGVPEPEPSDPAVLRLPFDPQ